jgi:DNA (cytosine-5)-methyltransferase 1
MDTAGRAVIIAGEMARPIGVDLFAGAGGLSLGFEQAGFDVAAAVEIDPIHCAVHKFNFPKTAILPHPIETLSGDRIAEAAGLDEHPVDCVFGGAPCQGFSLIGHRVLDDPRNRLVRDFVRIVAELDARTFVFENVKGLTVGKHRRFLDEFMEEFSEAGYDVRVPWRVLNAGQFAAPQHRERLILLGARKGESLPDYPAPSTNIVGGRQRTDVLPDGPTCADALGDLPDADLFDTLVGSDCVKTGRFGEASTYAAELRCLANDAWHFGHVREWNPALLEVG